MSDYIAIVVKICTDSISRRLLAHTHSDSAGDTGDCQYGADPSAPEPGQCSGRINMPPRTEHRKNRTPSANSHDQPERHERHLRQGLSQHICNHALRLSTDPRAAGKLVGLRNNAFWQAWHTHKPQSQRVTTDVVKRERHVPKATWDVSKAKGSCTGERWGYYSASASSSSSSSSSELASSGASDCAG